MINIHCNSLTEDNKLWTVIYRCNNCGQLENKKSFRNWNLAVKHAAKFIRVEKANKVCGSCKKTKK
jgi:hypothetical protein